MSKASDVAAANHKLLLRYVQEGGGLLVLRSVNYAFGRDVREMNDWLQPCGVEILDEQVVDDEFTLLGPRRNRLYWKPFD